MPIDYSKWFTKDIEISDDEDDTHPNVDTPSLFRWRHQARLEKQAEAEKEKTEFEKKKQDLEKRRQEFDAKWRKAEADSGADLDKLKLEEAELKKDEEEMAKKEAELKKKEKKMPWNVDTISKDKFAKTVINKESARQDDENLTEEERSERYRNFIEKNKSNLKHFGMLQRYEDSKSYLQEHSDLVCEDTANYLVIWCLELEMEGKHDLMNHVAHQSIVMQFILELSKSLKQDPRSCVGPFFSKMQIPTNKYKEGFSEELKAFKARIQHRAQEKLAAAMKEVEEEERKQRLGPGGLDPVEVLESLPEKLKQCFESKDVKQLEEALSSMKDEEAEYHMDRCVKAGLWKQENDSS